jgi:hypothetical protein
VSELGRWSGLEVLKGRHIKAVYIDPSKSFIGFETDQGRLGFDAEADCCSESWIEHVSDVNSLRPSEPVTEVVEHAAVKLLGTRQSEDEIYAYEIKTDSFYGLKIELRNSSNGYYGGRFAYTDGWPSDAKVLEEDF